MLDRFGGKMIESDVLGALQRLKLRAEARYRSRVVAPS
jgi:hypothetical protein